jgi:hypothetical protein
MKIGGRRTPSVFERYAVVSLSDIAEASGNYSSASKSAVAKPIHVAADTPDDFNFTCATSPALVPSASMNEHWCPEGDLNPHEVALCGF